MMTQNEGQRKVTIGEAGAKVVARASLVAGKEDRISALPSPQVPPTCCQLPPQTDLVDLTAQHGPPPPTRI